MTLTPAEACVLDFCKRRSVFTLEQICSRLHLAPITIRRALKTHGYFSSFNHNSRYYTLAERPRFDANGLWFYRSIGFSCHHTLTRTLVVLVQDADAGATPEELAKLLLTPVSNLLASLAQQQQLARRRLGHRVVYLSCDSHQQEQQWRLRVQPGPTPAPTILPGNLALAETLVVLVELIRSPAAGVERVVRTLHSKGLAVSGQQVQALVDHHQLEKKRHAAGRTTPSRIAWRRSGPLATTRDTAPERRLHL
jgi:hypothetical protein